MSLLDEIAAATRDRIERERTRVPIEPAGHARAAHDFAAGLTGPDIRIIAEIKRRSPSSGELASSSFDPVAIAGDYLDAGAAAISVLTEPVYFGGGVEILRAVRSAFPDAKLLMKDFVIDDYQVAQAADAGADAVLLIAGLLGVERLSELQESCRRLGLQALVEVHDRNEVAMATAVGAALVGVNNRDLKTMTVSLETSYRLAELLPRHATLIAESGVENGEQLGALQEAGFHAALVGTSLMRTGDPGKALRRLIEEAIACV